MKKQYATLTCYYGHWPNYFQFWLTSCKYNTGIDFFLVTDIDIEDYYVPQNVIIIRMTFNELVSKIKNTIKLPKGKDMIFPCGHLSFVRNIEPFTEVYKIIGEYGVVDWETAFSISEYHFLDEHGGLHPFFKSKDLAPFYYRKPDFDNIYPPHKRKWSNFKSINFPEKSHFLCFTYEEGHLYRNYLKGLKVQKEEISYLHISRREMEIKAGTNKQRFVIFPNCFDNWQDFSVFSLIWHGK